MTGLPSKISNTAPAQPSLKQTASDNANQQDESGFSNVLARQVDDADKKQPAASTSKEQGKQTKTAQSTETAQETDKTPAEFSSDMLATLLVQQNPDPLQQPEHLSRLTTGNLRGTTQTIQEAIPDTTNLQPSLAGVAGLAGVTGVAGVAGVASVDTTDSEFLATAATAKPGFAGKGKMEITDRQKASAAMETGIQSNVRLQNGNPTEALTLAAPSHQLTAPLPASVSTTTNTINTPVTQPAWGDELGQKITWMATQRNQSAELHLNPPQLGPLDVTLKINGDQATALFASPHAAVRDAIEQALPRLREVLAESGIMLGNATVSDQSAKHSQDNAPRKSQGGSSADSVAETAAVNNVLKSGTTAIRQHNGMVDTFA